MRKVLEFIRGGGTRGYVLDRDPERMDEEALGRLTVWRAKESVLDEWSSLQKMVEGYEEGLVWLAGRWAA